MSEEQKVSQSGEPRLVSFRAYPIETAPKDREIMLFTKYGWRRGVSGDGYHASWHGTSNGLIVQPTHWAELSEMVPTSEPGSTKEGDSLPASPSEAKPLTPTDGPRLGSCPFCGCLATIHAHGHIFGSSVGYRVECEGKCHAMTCYWHTEEEAVTHWNMREES